MILLDLINYKDYCPICNNKLLLCCNNIKYKIHLDQNYMLLKHKANEVKLKFDNTYEPFIDKVQRRNIRFLKQCTFCMNGGPDKSYSKWFKDLGLSGLNTLRNLDVKKYFYTFHVQLNKDNSFSSKLTYESFHYVHNNNFYGLNVNLETNQTGLIAGNLKQSLNDMLFKEFNTAIKTNQTKTLEEWVTKIDTLALFL